MACTKKLLPWVGNSRVEGLKKMSVVNSSAFGQVYTVIYNNRRACVKRAHNNNLFKNFVREASLLYLLEGAGGAPRLLAISLDHPTYVMSYVPGVMLKDLLDAMDVTSLINFFEMLLAKLEEIHARSIVHCDLKADNIIIKRNADNSLQNIHIIDFGHARVIGEALLFNRPEEAKRKEWYAPELITGNGATPAADFYSLGILLRRTLESVSDVPKPLKVLADKLTQVKVQSRANVVTCYQLLQEAKCHQNRYRRLPLGRGVTDVKVKNPLIKAPRPVNLWALSSEEM